MIYLRVPKLLFGLATLTLCSPIFAVDTEVSRVRQAVVSLSYEPAIPSRVPKEWEAWESSVNELIAAVAGSAKRRASAADIFYESRRAGLDVNAVYVLMAGYQRSSNTWVSAFAEQ